MKALAGVRDGEPHDEVGGVTARGQHTLALGGLVDGALVQLGEVVLVVVDLDRLEPGGRHDGPQHLGEGVRHAHVVVVPARAVHEEAVEVGADAGVLLGVELELHHLEVPHDAVDGDLVRAGKVLKDARQERLLEEVRREPEHVGGVVLHPVVEERVAQDEFLDVGEHRLQRGVRHLHPRARQLVGQAPVGDLLEVRGEHDQPLHSLAQIVACVFEPSQEAVDLTQLHVQHDVEALVVIDWVRSENVADVKQLGQPRGDVCGDLGVGLLRGLGLGPVVVVVAGHGRPEGAHHHEADIHHVGAFVDGGREAGVVVEPEGLGRGADGQRPDVGQHVLQRVVGAGRRGVVDARGGELVILRQDLRRVEVLQDDDDGANILVVRDAAAVVGLRHHVVERLPGHAIELVEETPQLLARDLAVRLREAVHDVPAHRAEAAALQDEAVEEAEPEEHLLELKRLVAAVEPLVVEAEVGAEERLLQALRRLDRHLDAHLQDGDRELRRGAGGKPKPEVRVHLGRVQLLHEGLERGHEARGQVAVLQQHPLAVLAALLDARNGLRSLALAQTDGVDLGEHVQALGKLLDVVHGVAARRKDVDQGERGTRVIVAHLQVQRRRLQEDPAKLVLDDRHQALRHGVRAEGEEQQRLLQRRALQLEVVRPLHLRGVVGVEDRLPAHDLGGELADEAVEDIAHALEDIDADPAHLREPVRVLRLLLLHLSREAREEGHDLVELQLLLDLLALETEHHGVEQLVLLEEAAADHDKEQLDERAEELHEALVLARLLLGHRDGLVEHQDEPVQRELVHRVHDAHVADDEVQRGASQGVILVELTHLGDLLPSDLLLLHLLLDLRAHHLGVAEGLDQLLVVEDVAGRRAQERQDLVLQLLQLRLGLRGLEHEVHALLLGRGLLRRHAEAQHLVLQAIQRGHEVEDADGDADLGREVRVRQLRRDVEREVLRPLDRGVAEAHHQQRALLEGRLLQHGVQDGVENLLDVLDQHRVPELDAVLELAHVVHRQAQHLELVTPRPLDPLVGLHLRVDHERPAAGIVQDDGVVDGKPIVREGVDHPLPDLDLIADAVLEVELLAGRDVLMLELGHPPDLGLHTVLAGEDAKVGNDAGGN
mmetsp:Transcript_98393/g.212145  ORF Transcript_98393/g.212145 Transcript_98393/m.212145 type:complete len:1113 (+) Transcript_98393:229-3567(+)